MFMVLRLCAPGWTTCCPVTPPTSAIGGRRQWGPFTQELHEHFRDMEWREGDNAKAFGIEYLDMCTLLGLDANSPAISEDLVRSKDIVGAAHLVGTVTFCGQDGEGRQARGGHRQPAADLQTR